MSDFRFHPDAHKDLDEIWEYVAAENLDAADRVIQEIYEAISGFVAFPYQGHVRFDLTSKPVRFQIVREFLIAYVPDAKPLVVLAVLHGRRHPRVLAALLRSRET